MDFMEDGKKMTADVKDVAQELVFSFSYFDTVCIFQKGINHQAKTNNLNSI